MTKQERIIPNGKLKMESPGQVPDNIRRIAELFPGCVTEIKNADGTIRHAIDFERLKAELGEEQVVPEGSERYQFTWPGKRAAARLASAPIRATLRPCREESVDFDTTKNLYIEGDNLDVLKCLCETYLGKVKMIYIDPPYNTGGDFVYRDDFKQSTEDYLSDSGQFDDQGRRMETYSDTSGRYHSAWLNMIYPRLRVARELLTDDGVIFISIDDHEVENLKKVCNEVFGEGNFVGCVAWRRTDNQPNIGNFARVKEYLLLYGKTMNSSLGRLPLSDKARSQYIYRDAKGLFRRSILLDKTRGRKSYPIQTKLGNILYGPWMVSKEEFDKMDANDEIYWTESGDGQPYGKIYLSDSKGQIPNDFWGIEFGTNQRASLELEHLMNKRYFDFPKPVSLLKSILMIGGGATPSSSTSSPAVRPRPMQ